MKLSNKAYDILKYIAQIVLPALATLWATLGKIWSWPLVTEISASIMAVDFFLVAGDNLATPMLSIDKYVSFLFGFIVPFGLAFQLPVALYLTTRIGWTNYKMLASKRKFVILGIFVFAAILTPPDVVSQLALGLPMILLYEIGIQACRFTKPRERE